MKRILFLLLVVGGFFFSAPQAQAAPGVCRCSDNHTIPNTEQTDCCQACANYAVTSNKEIERASSWKQNVSTGEYAPLSCGGVYFCWCAAQASTTNAEDKCFLARNDYTAITTREQCTSVCSQPTSNYGTTGRFFETSYNDRTGTSASNICGSYCWCNKPTADTGEVTTCELHRDALNATLGRNIPINSQAECSAACGRLTSPGGTRRGTFGVYETTYTNRSGQASCAAVPGSTPNTPNSPTTPTTRPNTPAPVIRLFNPMAGASTIVDIVNRIIKLLMGLVGAGALLMFIYGGIKWMTAGGDAKNVADAQAILKNSTLGLLLLIFAYTLVSTFFSVLAS